MDGEKVQKVRCKDCGETSEKSIMIKGISRCCNCNSSILVKWNGTEEKVIDAYSAVGKPCHVGDEILEVIVRYDPRPGYIPYVGATGKRYKFAEICE